VWSELGPAPPFPPIESAQSGMVVGPQGHFTHDTEGMWPLHFKHSHWWEKQSRSKFAPHYGSMWMQDGCKACKDSYMASNGSCFMVTWIIFQNHLLEIGLTKPKDHGTSERSQPSIYSILPRVRTCMTINSFK
jgi:hypothetical protein